MTFDSSWTFVQHLTKHFLISFTEYSTQNLDLIFLDCRSPDFKKPPTIAGVDFILFGNGGSRCLFVLLTIERLEPSKITTRKILLNLHYDAHHPRSMTKQSLTPKKFCKIISILERQSYAISIYIDNSIC